MLIVFGSLNVDLVMTAAAFPKPGQTITNGRFQKTYGGKGANQALAARLSQTETRVAFAGAVGKDDVGEVYSQYLASHNVYTFIKSHEGPTGTAVILVSENESQNLISVDPGANLLAKAPIDDTLIEQFFDLGDTVVLMQMEVPMAENIALIERAKSKGAITILNLAPYAPVDGAVLDKLDYLIVNEDEARDLSGISEGRLESAALDLAQRHDLTCIVTLGGEGCLTATPSEAKHYPAMKIDVVDPTGAGDAFCGTFAAALEQKLSLEDAIKRALVAGSLTCTQLGAQVALPTAAQIDLALKP